MQKPTPVLTTPLNFSGSNVLEITAAEPSPTGAVLGVTSDGFGSGLVLWIALILAVYLLYLSRNSLLKSLHKLQHFIQVEFWKI